MDGETALLVSLPPSIWSKTLRRTRVVKSFRSIDAPDGDDIQDHADMLGLNPCSFYRLIRAYGKLSAGVVPAASRRGIRRSLPQETEDIVDAVRTQMGRETPERLMLIEIGRRCAAAGITAPSLNALRTRDVGSEVVVVRSRSALRRLVREMRDEGAVPLLAGSPPNMMALDMVPIEIAIDAGGIATLPLATLVLHPHSGAVLSALLSLGAPSPDLAATAIARWIDGLPDGEVGTRIDHALISGTLDPCWTRLFDALARHGISRSGKDGSRFPAGPVAEDALGRTVLGFAMRPRMAHRPVETRRPLPRSRRLGGPIPLAEAQAAIDDRIAAGRSPDLFVRDARAVASELRATFAR